MSRASGNPEITFEVGALIPQSDEEPASSGRAPSEPHAVQAAAAPYWTTREVACLDSFWVDSVRTDSCYKIEQLINDGSTTKNYYSLRHRATSYEYEEGLRSAWISGERIEGTTAQKWIEWNPDTNYNNNCQSISVSLSYLGVSTGGTYTQCEKWTHTKSCNQCNVYYRQTWDCDCWPWMSSNETAPDPLARTAAYIILVEVPSGYSPRWRLGIGVAA